MRMAEETRQKLTFPSKAILADESKAAVVEVFVTIFLHPFVRLCYEIIHYYAKCIFEKEPRIYNLHL